MALSDLYQITHQMTQQAKVMVSVYHVERASGIETWGSVSDAFQNSILPAIRLLQNAAVMNDELRIFNLGVTTDFGTAVIATAGLRVGAVSPTFISGAVRFPTKDRAIRSGHKRFMGMEETDYTNGVLVAAANTLLENIGDDMIGDWLSSIDSHVVCNYVIIKRVCEEVEPVTEKCLEYRLPEPPETPEFYTPDARVVNQQISSQVSRKVF